MQLKWLASLVVLLALSIDGLVLWPKFSRQYIVDAAKARRRIWVRWMGMLWGCSILVLALWFIQRVPMVDIGLQIPSGWRLWLSIVLLTAVAGAQTHVALKIRRMEGPKFALRDQLGNTGQVMPHVASELPLWLAASLSAGFCEELLFRGFFVWLFDPLAGPWGAGVAALAIFSAAHAYQGPSGMLRSAILGAILATLVAITHSLWPAIVLHATLDWMGGVTAWLILRGHVRHRPQHGALEPG